MFTLPDMIHRLRILSVAAVLSLAASPVAMCAGLVVSRDDVEVALKDLDRELRRRDEYISRAEQRIDSVKQLRAADRPRSRAWLDRTMDLARRYTAFNNDSLLYYLVQGRDAAKEAGQDSLAVTFGIRLYTYLPLSGFVDDAVRGFDMYKPEDLPHDMRWMYYAAGKQMYSYVAAFYSNYPEAAEQWSAKSLEAQQELLKYLEPGSWQYRLNYGETLLLKRRHSEARAMLEPLLDELPVESNYYARACFFMAELAKSEGNHEAQLYYLARSALSDAVAPTLEVTALQELGQQLYREGDIDRAYNYLLIALANAVDCNAILRQIETSRTLPVIQKANQSHERQRRSLVYLVIAVLAITVCVLVGTLWYLRRQMRRMSVMQIKLRRANKTREVYINQFLTLCTIYIEKLKHYNNLVNRKLSAGQADELYKSTKTGKFIEEQVREFYNVFDDAFLHIYPSFVRDVNALLQPDKQITLREGELLNTDLRILAFMRLGIEDATRVAQILNYSVNTIYTYRNKLRNRAVNRETFERDIMRTGNV